MNRESKPQGVYLLTGDPTHIGHSTVIYRSLESGLVSGVDVVVTADHPWKPRITPFVHRLAITTLSVMEFFGDDERIRVNGVEDKLPKPNYSYATLEYLLESYREILPIFGSDVIEHLHLWENIVPVLRKTGALVVPRAGYTVYPIQLKKPFKDRFEIMQGTPIYGCSSDFRKISEERRLAMAVGELAAQYIFDNKLYAFANS